MGKMTVVIQADCFEGTAGTEQVGQAGLERRFEHWVLRIVEQAAREKLGMDEFEPAERGFDKVLWWDFDKLSWVGPQCHPETQPEVHAGSCRVVQLVSMDEEALLAVGMETWSTGGRQDLHID